MALLDALAWKLAALLADASLRSLLLAVVAAAVVLLGRLRAAALRHAIWCTVLLAMLGMPLLGVLLPPLRVPLAQLETTGSIPQSMFVPSDARQSANGAATQAAVPRTQQSPRQDRAASAAVSRDPAAGRWPAFIAIVYLAVAFGFLLRALLGYAIALRLVHRSTPIKEARPRETFEALAVERRFRWPLPELRESRETPVPFTIGWKHPAVLLDDGWRGWGTDKLRAVLAHELEHIRRRDWLLALLASLNKCVFWFHPLAWWLEARLASLAEQSSDEGALLSSGDTARYAEVVLEFAAGLNGRRRLALDAGMARCSNVSRRVDRILGLKSSGSAVLRPTAWVVVLGCALPLTFCLAAAQFQAAPQAQPAPRIQYPDMGLQGANEGFRLTPADAERLEQMVAANPEDLDARMKLIGYYFYNAMFDKRDPHVFWLIEHHPEMSLALSSAARIAFFRALPGASPSAAVNPPENYQRAKILWLQEAAAHANDARVLANAAEFVRQEDPEQAERLLKQAVQIDPSRKQQLVQLYADTIKGSPLGMFVLGSPQADSSFRDKVRAELQASNDAELVGAAGEMLARMNMRPARVEMKSGPASDERTQAFEDAFARAVKQSQEAAGFAETLLVRAQSLDPANQRWQQALGRLRNPQPVVTTEQATGLGAREQASRLDSTGRLRVGSQLQADKLIQGPLPEYPPLARQKRIQGTVRMEVVLSTDGHVSQIKIVDGHPLLVQAAMEAVKNWVYQPTYLNGKAVEVLTEVDVPFTLL